MAAKPPTTVERVDLQRYSGTWFEIAKFPQWFELGCENVTATYSVLPDGTVSVWNRCQETGGRMRDAKGIARVADSVSNAKLKVKFNASPFEGDYWVLRLSDDYSTAAVGSPDRGSLWILHREKKMEEGAYRKLVESLKSDGFDVGRLERTKQEGGK
jgi:apolipoprotein D and lipocalin family protein